MLKKIAKILLAIIALIAIAFFVMKKPDKSVEWIKDKYADEDSKFALIGDQEVHYKKEGSGNKILLLLHGTGASLHTWDGWVDTMKDSLTVYRLDLPAFGITGPASNADYSIKSYVDFVDQFATNMGIDSFGLAGNSLGGNIAWNYTLEHKNKVTKLILIDAAGYPSDKTVGIFKMAQNPILSNIIRHITPRSLVEKNLLEVYNLDDRVTDPLVDRYWHMTLREGNRQAFIDRARTKYQDRSHLISEINCPTLIMWGQKDDWIDVSYANQFIEDISNSSLIIYPNLGHVPMEEEPTSTSRDALGFILNY